jgi:single-strand DNA-binding protein
MNLNKVFLIGRLTQDPQLRQTALGTPVSTFSLATNRVYYDKIAGKKEEVEFHNIVVWGKTAEVVARYLQKGAMAYVEGRIQTRSWDDKEGNKRKTTEIIAERVQLGPRAMNQGMGGQGAPSSGFTPKAEESSVPFEKSDAAAVPTIDFESSLGEIEMDSVSDDIKPEDLPF